MKILKIDIYKNGVHIGECNYTKIQVLPKTNIAQFFLIDCQWNTSIPTIEDYDKFEVKIFNFNHLKDKLSIIDLIIKPHGYHEEETKLNDICITGHILSKWETSVYEQDLIDSFKRMEDGLLDWDKLSVNEKYFTLIALAKIYGQPKQLIGQKALVLGKKIKCDYDIYYQIGNQLVGEHRYFAVSLDALEDTLITLSRSLKNIEITFTDVNLIKSKVDNYSFSTMLEIFNEFGVKCILK